MPSPSDQKWLRVLEGYVIGEENAAGERRMRCPLHDDHNPSASVNIKKNVFNCLVCGGGTLRNLKSRMDRRFQEVDEDDFASYDPFDMEDAKTTSNVRSIIEARSVRKHGASQFASTKDEIDLLTEAKIKDWHEALLNNKNLQARLFELRLLTIDTIRRYEIGYQLKRWDEKQQKDFQVNRFTIPIRSIDGDLVNARKYKPNAIGGQKMLNQTGYGKPPRLMPVDQLKEGVIVVMEGEWDALLAIQMGIPAVSGTGGAKRWDPAWGKLFKDKIVYLCYDNDKDGRDGARKAAHSIRSHASAVFVMPALLSKAKSDFTDWVKAGGTAEQFSKLMESCERLPDLVEKASDGTYIEPVSVKVIGSMDSSTNGKPLRITATVTGKKGPTFSAPKNVHFECTMDAGRKCEACPMSTDWDGDKTLEISSRRADVIAQLIEVTTDRQDDRLRSLMGIKRCDRLEIDKREAFTVEELFVTGSVDRRSQEGHDYTQRRVYYTGGSGETPTNADVVMVGTTTPNPKDQRNEFFAWHLEEAKTSIDSFVQKPGMKERLSIFQPRNGQTVLQKCMEIAEDMTLNVTHVFKRERLHVAMDLVWHSMLQFEMDGKVNDRGWLEFIVVGDTRTGKSKTALSLSEHYGLGHIIDCEGATLAGLVGGVKQVGEAWTVQWGEIPLNDRRLCVLDEASGLSQEIISQMSGIRSRGEAQLTKVESQQTTARCRMIWISNPRKSKFVDEKPTEGIRILEDLIGNPEDIARFDFAMSVAEKDVPDSEINVPDKGRANPAYSSEACNELILWCWSRKPDQIEFTRGAYLKTFEAASWLSERYVGSPPLIQGQAVREKISRLAAAFAGRTFSCDETGERLIVTEHHIKAAVNFLDKIYSYPNFGYRRLSNRILRDREIARGSRNEVRSYLLSRPNLYSYLIRTSGKSFRAQDLEEMAFMDRTETNDVLSTLAKYCMITKSKSQIILEPEFQDLLREMENDS